MDRIIGSQLAALSTAELSLKRWFGRFATERHWRCATE